MPQKRPYSPRPAAVKTVPPGCPAAVQGVEVEQIKEEWLVEDDWWTGLPLKRHYFEVVLSDGRNLVVFKDEGVGNDDRWYLQRA
jgi:hypothetical protein